MTMTNDEELKKAWDELDNWDDRCPTCGCIESGCEEVGCLSDEWEDNE